MSGDKRERIVIVGAGAAGLRAAERLRELRFEGELIIVSEEPYRPYHRPALCKQLLTGSLRSKDITLPVHTELDAVWRYGVRASRLDTEEHVVHLPGGEDLRYDGLVIATGAQARHLPGAPRHDPRVQVLRTIADAAAVKKAIAHSRNGVAVIGGGFVGCEVASAARELGRDATIIVRGDRLLDRVPGEGFGEAVAELHRTHGVQVITRASVRNWVPQSDGMALHLTNGQVVLASCVVLGIGGVPAVDWLRGSGLILDDGVMCDPTCHAVGASDVVVAGDIARWPNLLYDTVPRRVEHWHNAIEMGRAAAENLLDGKDSAKPYTPMPRFWSEQHGVRIQAAGIPALASDTVPLSGSVRVGHRVTGYVNGGSLVGVVGWDSPRGMMRWTGELEEQLTTAMRRRKAMPQRESRRPRPAFVELEPNDAAARAERELVMAGTRAGRSEPLDPPSMAGFGPLQAFRAPQSQPARPARGATPVRPAAPPSTPREDWVAELPPVSRGPAGPAAGPPMPPPPPYRGPAEGPPPVSRTPVPPNPPSRSGPMDHPSFPRMRPVPPPRPPRGARAEPVTAAPWTASPPPQRPPADHPSFPRMRPVEPPRMDRPGQPRPADHPSFPRMQPAEPPRATPPAPPTRPFPAADHPSFPRMQPAEPPRTAPPAPPTRPFPAADHPSFPRMRPVPPHAGPMDHPSFPRMRPVEPAEVRRPGEPPLRAAEITMPSLENLRIPDHVPDMSKLSPAEQSWPRLRPVEPPPNVRVPELSLPGTRTPGARPPEFRSPEARDLFA